jgi:hypothetical protein
MQIPENCTFLCSAADKNESGKHQAFSFPLKGRKRYDYVCDSQSVAFPPIISENIKRCRVVW